MTLWTTVSNFWIKRVKDSAILLFIAGSVFFVSMIIGAQSSLLISEQSNPGLVGKAVWGLGVLIGGALVFGSTPMGLNLKKARYQKVYIIVLPFAAMLLLNAFGTSIASIRFENLKFAEGLVAGFSEEVIFRGFCFALWARVIGLRSPLLLVVLLCVTSLGFGLVHDNDTMEVFIFRTGLGFLLGVVVIYTETIYFSMALHAFNNGLSDVMGGNGKPEVQIVGIILICLIGLWVVLTNRLQVHYLSFHSDKSLQS